MSGELDHDAIGQSRAQEPIRQVEQPEAQVPAQEDLLAEPAPYPGLTADPNRLRGRGNAPVRAAMFQGMQQTYGNRAVQRFLRVQRSSSQSATSEEDTAERIESRAGGGNALDSGVRRTLEGGLGADLSGVRVHTDGEADHLARSVDAVAFTTGNDIFFRGGAYDPSTTGGMHLLAHEATHTVQQSQGPVAGTPSAGGVSISDPSDAYERAAEQAAANVVSGKPASLQPLGSSGPSAPVQRESTPGDDEEELPVQNTRSSMAVQRESTAGDEEDEGMAVQSMRESTARVALQRDTDDGNASSVRSGPQSRRSTVIQRFGGASLPVSQGVFEFGMETQEGAVAGTGPSGEKGTIKFVPDKGAPYSNHIALQQIVKLTDTGGANINPVSLPTATGAEICTKEDKAAGVEGGFFTDVLHNDAFGTKKDAPKGEFLSLNYPFSSTGSQVLGFKRSEEDADIKAAELFDFPGTTSKTANFNFSFETVAKGTDSGNIYGAVKWAFGLTGGKVVNEDGPHVDDVASPTFASATGKHQDFYVHVPLVFHFGFDSDEMDGGEEAKIDTEVLDYLKRFPDVRLTLQGFADQRGSITYNKQLAARRGDRVAQALIAQGVAADRINPIVAKGATTAFTSDATTDQDREANRQGNRTVICQFEHTASIGTPP